MDWFDLPQEMRDNILNFTTTEFAWFENEIQNAGGQIYGNIIDKLVTGSYASGDATAESDYDIIFLTDAYPHAERVSVYKQKWFERLKNWTVQQSYGLDKKCDFGVVTPNRVYDKKDQYLDRSTWVKRVSEVTGELLPLPPKPFAISITHGKTFYIVEELKWFYEHEYGVKF
jgi:predicted nucleotidyltransferase